MILCYKKHGGAKNVSADYIQGLPEGLPYGHSKTKRR
jgi:hypothetical protein